MLPKTTKPALQARRTFFLPIAGVFLYGLCAVLFTYPLVLNFGSAVISHWGIDIEHSLWVQWWFAQALDTPGLAVFRTAMLHYPNSVDLQFADINFAINVPFYLLTKVASLTVAYNLMLLLSFVLSATLMWRLAYGVCGNRTAAWAAGGLYAASPYWLCCVLNAWVYLVHIWVFPLVFLALGRAKNTLQARDSVLCGLAFGLTFHVSPYYCLYLAVLVAACMPWHISLILSLLRQRRGWTLFAIALVTMLLTVLPRALPMYAASHQEFVAHHGPLNTALGARLAEMVTPSAARVQQRLPGVGFLVVFLSYTLLGAIGAGLWVSERRRSYAPWLISGTALLILSLGPYATLGSGDHAVTLPLPDYLLQRLPVFAFLTNHWRWSLPAVFSLVIGGALGLADIARFLERRGYASCAWMVALVLLVYGLEAFLLFPFPARKPLWPTLADPLCTALRQTKDVNAVLDLTEFPKLHQIEHRKPIAGGWLPRLEVRTFQASEEFYRGFAACKDPQAGIRYLGNLGIDAIILSKDSALLIRPDPQVPGAFTGQPLAVGSGLANHPL
ncbi:MAG: hypothetical protein V2A79_04265 [Planctomycetota bacterium]